MGVWVGKCLRERKSPYDTEKDEIVSRHLHVRRSSCSYWTLTVKSYTQISDTEDNSEFTHEPSQFVSIICRLIRKRTSPFTNITTPFPWRFLFAMPLSLLMQIRRGCDSHRLLDRRPSRVRSAHHRTHELRCSIFGGTFFGLKTGGSYRWGRGISNGGRAVTEAETVRKDGNDTFAQRRQTQEIQKKKTKENEQKQRNNQKTELSIVVGN